MSDPRQVQPPRLDRLRQDAREARDVHLRQRLRSAQELTDILEKLNIRVL